VNPVSSRVAEATRSKTASVADAAAPKSSKPGVARYLVPGQKIAERYEVLGVLGEGGMGVVYRCRDLTGELLAVKRVVLPAANADEHLGWFLAEAQALAGLCHDNIVRARDFGQLRDGTPYLAMELVSGVSLQELVADPLPLSLLWTLTDQVLAALAHAHARGVVHGDLKPSNLVVENDCRLGPRVRLFDFGLAKRCRPQLDLRLGQKSAPSHPPPSAGTPGYMAPEQILGRRSEICPATDLYALGCILYRALAGRAPFTSESRRELDFHCFREPAPLVPEVDVPNELVAFVMRLLQKRPWDRASSAADVRAHWRNFQPATRAHHEIGGNTRRKRQQRDEVSTGSEVTRRISPRGERSASVNLRRSNRWLPGLLSIRPSPLVGRSALCRHLLDRFESVAAEPRGKRHAILLTGQAGVGKSRLADWLCTEVEEAGSAVVLRGFRAGRPGRDSLAVAIADRYGLGGGALRMLPASLAERCLPDDLGALVDWILRCLDAPTETGRARGDARTGLSILRVLVEIAGTRPLLLWLDDPAELCVETLAMLAALPRHAPTLRLMVVTTARPEALGKASAVACVRSLRGSLETEFLPVPPLDSLTTSALLRAAHPIDSALALQIALDSGGVPLDALDRLFALAKRGRIG
jgi:eukaryotic-like serine/threonine-protein kinase